MRILIPDVAKSAKNVQAEFAKYLIGEGELDWQYNWVRLFATYLLFSAT